MNKVLEMVDETIDDRAISKATEILKKSIASRGRKITWSDKIVAAKKVNGTYYPTQESIDKVASAMRGKKKSAESNAKRSATMRAKSYSTENRMKEIDANQHLLVFVDLKEGRRVHIAKTMEATGWAYHALRRWLQVNHPDWIRKPRGK